MTLIVTDANGKKYKPTGEFREPREGDFYWSFHNEQAERYAGANTGHSLWGWKRIILAPVPVSYVAHVRLTQEQFDRYKGFAESATAHALDSLNVIATAIRNGDYEEVPQ